MSWCAACGAIGWGKNDKIILYPFGVQSRKDQSFINGYQQAAKDTLAEAANAFSGAIAITDNKFRDEVDLKAKILRNWAAVLMRDKNE